ncbi:hypothetical protein SAMN02745244_02804 [Tessaracoccus bendigoensis DSM 12906]|uniref:PIN domain-containing protein n=1 Tax=Tessaracoccus bendigoensis DSM 12906 TaxID=1123357 RepID=A0A1M6KEW8_9ACTN|nr:hypothetical protein [Tessaracoccus bendigoensis]SHJ57505.1 hypothetical protein SAMN02745244_02804 [Tessaracoccus bendigoensis DSM 12906]
MSHLLDTNVISELRKPAWRADVGVRGWVAGRAPSDLYLSAITVLEVEVGIGQIAPRDPVLGARLQAWLDDALLDSFSGRILSVDVPVTRPAFMCRTRGLSVTPSSRQPQLSTD